MKFFLQVTWLVFAVTLALFFFTLAAISQEAPIYRTPRIPSEAEKVEALKLGYILNGFSMSRAAGEGSIDLTIYTKPLVLPSTIPPALKPDEVAPDGVWPPPPRKR